MYNFNLKPFSQILRVLIFIVDSISQILQVLKFIVNSILLFLSLKRYCRFQGGGNIQPQVILVNPASLQGGITPQYILQSPQVILKYNYYIAIFCQLKMQFIRSCLFTLPDPDSNSDLKPNGYIVICRTFHPVRSRIQIPTPTAKYRNEIGIGICFCECK